MTRMQAAILGVIVVATLLALTVTGGRTKKAKKSVLWMASSLFGMCCVLTCSAASQVPSDPRDPNPDNLAR
jgi:hypothetical protein